MINLLTPHEGNECMKSLWHNGILIPESYQPKGYKIKYKGIEFIPSPKQEEMLVAWVKKLGTEYVQDPVFVSNFLSDLSKEFGKVISSPDELDLSIIILAVQQEKEFKEKLDKETKKRLAAERKLKREALKEKYGYALVDGVKTEISGYCAEPSSIFMGRGKHPRRGCWKEGPKKEDIKYNLSPDAPIKDFYCGSAVWHPNEMWVARWKDKFSDKMKYIWLSDSSKVKQSKEIEKFQKAARLESRLTDIRDHIRKGAESMDGKTRKVATVCYLIDLLNIRVGDEKDPDEADTVGATTLRKEHVKLLGNDRIGIEFLGKDSVLYKAEIHIDHVFYQNLEEFTTLRELIFEGITSQDVSRFLGEIEPGLTAKVFRTYKATLLVKKVLDSYPLKKKSPEYEKKFVAVKANIEAAKFCNHKRKIPKNWEQTLEKKKERLKKLTADPKTKKEKLEELSTKTLLYEESRDYNLNTSLKSYIDPRAYVDWANNVEFDLTKLYNKTLRKKYSWALNETK